MPAARRSRRRNSDPADPGRGDFVGAPRLIAAGFDGREADPLRRLELKTEDFTCITGELCQVAAACCDGRLISTLEAG